MTSTGGSPNTNKGWRGVKRQRPEKGRKELSMSSVEKGHELELAKELENFRKEGKYNVLVPTATLQEISPFHKPVLEIVNINPDPKGGDVYEVVSGSGNYSMTAASLSKISFAAGLIWNAKGCQRTDDGSKPKEVSYRMEAVVRKEDGTYMPLNAEYLIDLDVINEEISNSYEAKSQTIMKDPKNKWKEADRVAYVARSIKRDMLQKTEVSPPTGADRRHGASCEEDPWAQEHVHKGRATETVRGSENRILT